MPENEHDTPKESDLSNRKFPSLTKEQENNLHQFNPSEALSPYEDPRKVEGHFPAHG